MNKTLGKPADKTTILVTGGAGFSGSHTCVELLKEGYKIVIYDNLSNSSAEAVRRVRELSGTDDIPFYEADILDSEALEKVFSEHSIDAIIHFAGLKAVGESVEKPLSYYWNNIAGTISLCEAAKKHGCKNIVFSSSATVYGDPKYIPITEDCPKGSPTNPYGWTKSMLEQVLCDLYTSDKQYNIVILRYFNPIGAHESGRIGEDPKDIPNNLLPYVAQVAVGKLERVGVFGNDYDTPDGTGVRDYIHVVDLARGHVAALEWMSGRIGTKDAEASDDASVVGAFAEDGSRTGVGVFNLGTGKGSTVLEVIDAFSAACGHEIPYQILPRRAGDIATNYAACNKAAKELNWVAKYDMPRMCEDSWRWQSKNPDGYRA